MKKGSAVALPSGTRYGAHVAPQRCTILRNGKAVISYHIRGVFYPLKFKIVLDMGYTSQFNESEDFWVERVENDIKFS